MGPQKHQQLFLAYLKSRFFWDDLINLDMRCLEHLGLCGRSGASQLLGPLEPLSPSKGTALCACSAGSFVLVGQEESDLIFCKYSYPLVA